MHHCSVGLLWRRIPPCHSVPALCFFGAICGVGPITSLTPRSIGHPPASMACQRSPLKSNASHPWLPISDSSQISKAQTLCCGLDRQTMSPASWNRLNSSPYRRKMRWQFIRIPSSLRNAQLSYSYVVHHGARITKRLTSFVGVSRLVTCPRSQASLLP